MDYKDYYKILGVDKSADKDGLKKAYCKLARKYHPDVNPGDKASEEKSKEVNEAYETLSDADKRKRYDMFGHARAQQGGGSEGFGFGGGGFGDAFNDIFEDFFGGQRGMTNPLIRRRMISQSASEAEAPCRETRKSERIAESSGVVRDGAVASVSIQPGIPRIPTLAGLMVSNHDLGCQQRGEPEVRRRRGVRADIRARHREEAEV